MTPRDDPDEHDLELAHDFPILLNRRQALGLLSGAGLAAALAAFGISQFSDRMQTALDGKSRKLYFDVRDYGAVGDGTTDDTTAIQAAIAAAMPVSGTVYLPHGTFGISAELQLVGTNRAVTLVGEGQESSVVKALAPAARITWGEFPTSGDGYQGLTLFGRPSLSRDFMFDGNLIATRGVAVGSAVGYGTWHNIHVRKVNGDGWVICPQNTTFIACVAYHCAGNGWTLDYGIQACEFIECHGYHNDGWGFQVRQSGGPGWGASAQPQSLRFVSGIVEQGGSSHFADTGLGGFHIREGLDITFERFELVETAGDGSLVLTPSTANGFVGRVVVRDCRVEKIYLDANSGGAAQSMGGSNEPLLLTGWNMITSIVNGSTAQIYVDSVGKLGRYTTEGTGAATSLRPPPRLS